MMNTRVGSDLLSLSGSYMNHYDHEESEDESPKTAGVIADWGVINRRLRQHGYQPVMVFPSGLGRQNHGGVALEELSSKNLQNTLDKLMTESERRQSMVQELISSSTRIQRDAVEERERVYRHVMEIRNLKRELEEEKLKVQEMEGVRLIELQRHGQEVQELKRTKTELVALQMQLQQKVSQREEEIKRLQQKCQRLNSVDIERLDKESDIWKHSWKQSAYNRSVPDQKFLDMIDSYESKIFEMQQELKKLKKEIDSKTLSHVGGQSPTESELTASSEVTPSTEKQLKECKMLIKLLESENTQLKLELESRPEVNDWKKAQKYNKQLERLLAQNNLSPPHRKHREGRTKMDSVAALKKRYSKHVEDLDFMPIDACRKHLKEVCSELRVTDLRDIPEKINSLNIIAENHLPMEKIMQDIVDVINSKDTPKLSDELLPQNSVVHESHCEKAWQYIVPTLNLWFTQLTGLQDLLGPINQLSFNLMPWKSKSLLEEDNGRALTLQRIKDALDFLCLETRVSPSEIQTDTAEEISLDHLKSIVAHFQKLFDIKTVSGVFTRMNELYIRLGEACNAMNNMREFLGLEPTCKASDVVNAVSKLSKAKHLLKVDDLPGIMNRLDQYDEFYPAFQSMISELKKLLRVQDMDEIVTAVTALFKFPPY
ncbi:centrosomal protein of 70 kDa-like [Stylophora pistillata]|uniref:centrosomal protein of 70 kDa-like n=1 Tax=Stylophora pistillata TaxID=50429 RepID=UPI000C0443BE|nr:centrosomal protein of 70 kDa-like [Stylophora pistillata]